jgi:anti-anti-sigma regulatory factor
VTRLVNIGAPCAAAELPGLRDRLISLIAADDDARFACDVGGLADLDDATLDGLARLQLTARRMGRELQLRNASAELHAMLALVGLCDVLGACDNGLRVEPRRQTEQREPPRRVEEEGDPAEPIA